MSRKHLVLSLSMFALLAALGVFLALKPKEQGPIIGPHTVPIRWFSYQAVHVKPWIDMFGIKFPKPPIDVSGLPVDDERFIEGYLVVDSVDSKSWLNGENGLAMSGFANQISGHQVLAVPYPKTTSDNIRVLQVGTEKVPITMPFTPGALPARFVPASVDVGAFHIRGAYKGYDDGAKVTLEVKPTNPAVTEVVVNYVYKNGSGMAGTLGAPMVVTVTGDVLPDGSISVTGDVSDDKTLKVPFKFILRPKPLP